MKLTKEQLTPEETVMPEGEDKFEWVDLTELAAKKYPHLGDDCE